MLKEERIMETITMGQAVAAFLAAMSIPGAITGFLVWNFQRKITARDKAKAIEEERRRKAAEAKEEAREQLQMIVISSTSAAIALGEATAKAVQRIPDAKCNGDMHAALEYAAKVKHEQKDFLTRLGVSSILE